MTDIQKLKSLAEAVRDLEDQPEKSDEHEEAKDALWLHMHCHTILDLVAEIERVTNENQRLRAGVDEDLAEINRIQAAYDELFRSKRNYRMQRDQAKDERDQLKAENESLRKDAERWRFVRNPIGNGSPFAVWSERTNLFLGKFADKAIDAAMSKEAQS